MYVRMYVYGRGPKAIVHIKLLSSRRLSQTIGNGSGKLNLVQLSRSTQTVASSLRSLRVYVNTIGDCLTILCEPGLRLLQFRQLSFLHVFKIFVRDKQHQISKRRFVLIF